MIDYIQMYINMENYYEHPSKILKYDFDYDTEYKNNKLIKLHIIIYYINGAIFVEETFKGNNQEIIETKLDQWLEKTFKNIQPRDMYLKF